MSKQASTDNFVVFDGTIVSESVAHALASKLGFGILLADQAKLKPDALRLIQSNSQWHIHMPNTKAVASVDFDVQKFSLRLRRANLYRERVVRAVVGRAKVGKTEKQEPLTVLDATAGFGIDGFLLAAAGCEVTMIERIPLLVFLLEEALQRAGVSPNNILADAASRIQLIGGDSLAEINCWKLDCPDVVYLDPMYDESTDLESVQNDVQSEQRQMEGKTMESEKHKHKGLKKSAAVKKNMALLQYLTASTNTTAKTAIRETAKTAIIETTKAKRESNDDLMNSALALAKKKVVVKRAPGAHWLGGVKPSSTLEGKAARFDVYAL